MLVDEEISVKQEPPSPLMPGLKSKFQSADYESSGSSSSSEDEMPQKAATDRVVKSNPASLVAPDPKLSEDSKSAVTENYWKTFK